MNFRGILANHFSVKDSVVEANVELFGISPDPSVLLRSIRTVEPIIEGLNSDYDFQVAYLAEQIAKEKKWATIAVTQGGFCVYSTSPNVKKGDRIVGRIIPLKTSGRSLLFLIKHTIRQTWKRRK